MEAYGRIQRHAVFTACCLPPQQTPVRRLCRHTFARRRAYDVSNNDKLQSSQFSSYLYIYIYIYIIKFSNVFANQIH